MPKRALILDLDGTLIDSIPCWIRAFHETLLAYGVEMDEAAFISRIYQRNKHLKHVLEAHDLLDEHEAFRKARDTRYVELLRSDAAWLPGAEAFLAEVGPAAALGIVTNSWQIYVDALEARFAIRERVGCLLSLDDFGPPGKPDPKGLLDAAALLGADPDACAYLGDQIHDMTAAKAAGMGAWLIHSGTTPAEADDHADRAFRSLAEVQAAWQASPDAPAAENRS